MNYLTIFVPWLDLSFMHKKQSEKKEVKAFSEIIQKSSFLNETSHVKVRASSTSGGENYSVHYIK